MHMYRLKLYLSISQYNVFVICTYTYTNNEYFFITKYLIGKLIKHLNWWIFHTYLSVYWIWFFETNLCFLLVLPHIIPFSLDEEVNSGESVQLSCHVSKGDHPLNIVWTLNSEELAPHLEIFTTNVGDRSSILTILSAKAAHSGNYTCSVANAAGSVNHTATVHVNGILLLHTTIPSICNCLFYFCFIHMLVSFILYVYA